MAATSPIPSSPTQIRRAGAGDEDNAAATSEEGEGEGEEFATNGREKEMELATPSIWVQLVRPNRKAVW